MKHKCSRLSKRQLICISICAFIALLLTIFVPLTYFVFVPNAIRSSLQSNESLPIQIINITTVTDSIVEFRASTALDRQSALPGTVTIQPLSVDIQLVNGTALGKANVLDPINAQLNTFNVIEINGKMECTNIPMMAELISGNLKENGFKLLLSTQATISLWGITWYRDFKIQFIHDMVPDNTLSFTLTSNPIPKQIRAPDLNSEIRSRFPTTELIALGPGLPDIVIANLSLVTMDFTNFVMNCTMFFENPIKVEIPLTTLGFSIGALDPLLDIRLRPQQGVWQLKYPQGSKIQSVPVVISMALKESSLNFISSLVSIGTLVRSNATLFGPFVVETPTRGQLLNRMTTKMSIALPPDVWSAALSTIASKMVSIITNGILGFFE